MEHLIESLESYSAFELPRNDISLLNEDLKSESNRMIRLKKYIIYLRRRKDSRVFQEYKLFLTENLNFFLSHLTIREIVSQVETYADVGNDEEKAISFGILNFMMQEKISLSLRSIYTFQKKRFRQETEFYLDPHFHSIRLGYDDALINFLCRVSAFYSRDKILNAFWIRLLGLLISNKLSTLHILLQNMSPKMRADHSQILNELMQNGTLNDKSAEMVSHIQQTSSEWSPDKSGHPEQGRWKDTESEIQITDETYTEQYKALHEQNTDYGSSSLALFEEVSLLVDFLKPKSVLDFGCGKGALIDKLAARYTEIAFHKYDPSIKGIDKLEIQKVDFVINTDVLEHIPEDLIDAVIQKIASLSSVVFFNLHHGAAKHFLPNGCNAHCTIKPLDWYRELLSKYFGELTVLVGRHELASVVVTTTLPESFRKKYGSVISRRRVKINKRLLKFISFLIPSSALRKQFRSAFS